MPAVKTRTLPKRKRRWTEADLLAKMAEYFESGAQEVWLLFPERKQAHRYRADLSVEVLHENDILHGALLLPEFSVRVGELFEE